MYRAIFCGGCPGLADRLPLLYAGAMLTDAVSALVFDFCSMGERRPFFVISTVIAAPFAVLVFADRR